jgi:hypothetical protein
MPAPSRCTYSSVAQEERCYISEQIDYSAVKFKDNQDVLDLIECRVVSNRGGGTRDVREAVKARSKRTTLGPPSLTFILEWSSREL